MEIWKDIKGYKGEYQVSNTGKVRSLNFRRSGKVKLLRPGADPNGYLRCVLCKGGICKTFKVHRLVTETFIAKNDPEANEVNHKNGVRSDNRVENLEWTTRLYNMRHSFMKLGRKGSLIGVFSSKHPRSKKINQYSSDGLFIKTWNSGQDIQNETNINKANISECCNGRRKTAGGYKWTFKN